MQAQQMGEVLVIGSSMLSRIRKKEFSEHVQNGEARFKVFPGATVDKINYYLLPELKEFRYKKVVIHCGTNDLFYRTAEEIVDSMGEIFKTCMDYGVETVIISSIVIRRCRNNIEEKRLTVNSLLKTKCETVGEGGVKAYFVDNGNILYEDLYTDGLHLVESGTVKLANNILVSVNNNY